MKCFQLNRMLLALAMVLVAGCGEGETDADAPAFACVVEQPMPYPNGIPYVGVHAGASNNDYVGCQTAPRFEEKWHALKGAAIAQPNTFSPDGQTIYLTSSQPSEGDCTVWALRASDGEVEWCKAYDSETIWSAVEVDMDGYLYLTTAGAVVSLNADGSDRWQREMPSGVDPERENGAVGLHFTPTGHVATVTDQGTVVLLNRGDGHILATLSIPESYGRALPPVTPPGVLSTLLPAVVIGDFDSLQMGGPTQLLSTFSGAGNFSDNTIGVAKDGTLYVIGGDGMTGALFQIRVTGDEAVPTLVPGWYMATQAGSASSPGISPDGRFVKVSDGNGTAGLINPRSVGATARIADIEACNDNTDSEPDPSICGEHYAVPLLTGPAMGTTPLLNEAVHYQYEIQVSDLLNEVDADIRAFRGEELLWETTLPEGFQWTSVITVSENHLIGTGTRFTDSGESILNLVELPATATSELMILDRATGEIAFRAPITDDSTATVTVGPDGALYVTMLCLMHTFAMETRPIAGVIRFDPKALE